MKNILILGAGLSSSSMIQYLLDLSETHHWKIKLGDQSKALAERKIGGHPNGRAIFFDVNDDQLRKSEIQSADIVVSMLPAALHVKVAEDCLRFGRDMFTASYVSPQMTAMAAEVEQKGLLFMNEIGVDPGIDHMSAMKVIHHVQAKGGDIQGFYSNTGGLIAPEYDTNPWNYKFTWNPRNVVVAGQGVAQYMEHGHFKYIPYHKLFERVWPMNIPGSGDFEFYPNRDSLKYRSTYGLNNIQTMLRGTIRKPGYGKAWNVFVQLGLTDDTFAIENSAELTYREFVDMYLPYNQGKTLEEKLSEYLHIEMNGDIMNKLKWLGILDETKTGIDNATPARILQHLLEQKWVLAEGDKDMIVMQHIFEYTLDGKNYIHRSSLTTEGIDLVHTAMARTVGLPLAICLKLFLTGKIERRGVVIPVTPDIYEPVLAELETYGICFVEDVVEK